MIYERPSDIYKCNGCKRKNMPNINIISENEIVVDGISYMAKQSNGNCIDKNNDSILCHFKGVCYNTIAMILCDKTNRKDNIDVIWVAK